MLVSTSSAEEEVHNQEGSKELGSPQENFLLEDTNKVPISRL